MKNGDRCDGRGRRKWVYIDYLWPDVVKIEGAELMGSSKAMALNKVSRRSLTYEAG